MRQVGKTTLLRELSQSYFTYDDTQLRLRAEAGNWGFLESKSKPVVIDECHLVPNTFSEIKRRVDERDEPGRYILTGSVRFLSKKEIRESLTGRTSILELLPMTLSECLGLELSRFVSLVTEVAEKKQSKPDRQLPLQFRQRVKRAQIAHYLLTGGLPGICFKRDSILRDRMYELQLETILSRDLDLISPTRLGYRKLRTILSEVYRQSAGQQNQAEIARRVGSSSPTIERVIRAMESLFLIKAHGDQYYPSDLGLCHFLTQEHETPNRPQWLRAIFCELHAQLDYSFRNQTEFRPIQNRGGIDVPFFIEFKNQPSIAITFDVEECASDRSLKSLTWLKKKKPTDSTLITVALHLGAEQYFSSSGHLCLPVDCLF